MVVSVKDNPLYSKIKLNIFYFIPQGWSFFTKDFERYNYKVYKEKNGQIHHISTKNSSIKYFFGLNKSNRILPSVIGNKISTIDDNLWYKLESSQVENINLDSINTVYIYENFFYVQGVYVVRLGEITPWYYYANDINYNPHHYYIRLIIK